MRPSRVILTAVIAIITFVVVMLFVTWLLEDVIFFSLFVGIPAGILAAVAVWVFLYIVFRSREGQGRP